MLTAYRFDAQQSERVDDWEAACKRVDAKNLVWLALRDPWDEEISQAPSTSAMSLQLV